MHRDCLFPVQQPPVPLYSTRQLHLCDTRLFPRQDPITFSLMKAQMIRVISSPSISTTGLATLIRLSASGERWQGVRGACPAPPAPAPQLCTTVWGQESSRRDREAPSGRVQVPPLLRAGCKSGCKPHSGVGQGKNTIGVWDCSWRQPCLGLGLGAGQGAKPHVGPGLGVGAHTSRGGTWVQAGLQSPM